MLQVQVQCVVILSNHLPISAATLGAKTCKRVSWLCCYLSQYVWS